jgi:hypothetical protein
MMECQRETALDSVLYGLESTDEDITLDTTDFFVNDIHNYNPYQTIPNGITPNTFWECLSVLNGFTPLSPKGQKDYQVSVILDLDPTDGCTMALRGRYPYSIIYCSSLKKWSKYADVKAELIMSDRRTPRTITEYLLTYNDRGCDFAFCVDQPEFDLQRQVHYSTSALKPGASIAIRIKDFESDRVNHMIDYILPMFDSVWIYKCATMSCVSNEAYVVGVSKRKSHGEGNLQGLEEVREYIARSKTSVVARIDNTHNATINSLTNEYMGC